MNGKGFIISEEHDVFIPNDVVAQWRKKFTALPDLEAQMGKLSAVILQRGIMHPGWNCPAGWMAGCLAKDNAEAARDFGAPRKTVRQALAEREAARG